MREELRLGKMVRSAVDSGYEKALFTIIDSHVTTLITAVVLFQFGTGPIKGFAVTLSLVWSSTSSPPDRDQGDLRLGEL